MAGKKRKRAEDKERYELIGIRVDDYHVKAEASINFYLAEPNLAEYLEDDPAYLFESSIEITGTALLPENRSGDIYEIKLIGGTSPSRRLAATVKDCQLRDGSGVPRYRSYRGREIAVYRQPPDFGLLEKARGERKWRGWANVAPRLLTDMLVTLSHQKQAYVSLHERRIERRRKIHGIALQTAYPAEE